MHKPIIADSWKMNKTLSGVQDFVEAVKNAVSSSDVVDAVIRSPALSLAPLIWNLKGSEAKLAVQNRHWESTGVFTSENSLATITDLDVDYVIIGRFERREYSYETDKNISKKAKVIFANDMTPVFCCDETLETYKAGKTAEWIEGQITKGLVGLSSEQVASIVIAYESIWVIGTGKSADTNVTDEVCGVVRSMVGKLYGKEVSEAVHVQYDSSVKPENIVEYMAKENVDGALAGGTSLEADSFLASLDVVRQEIINGNAFSMTSVKKCLHSLRELTTIIHEGIPLV